MHKPFRKAISLLLAILIVTSMLSAFTLTAAAEADPFIAHGQCGRDNLNDVEYYVFDDGTIAFFPTGTTGAIKDYIPDSGSDYPKAPWYDLGNQLTAASFQSTKISIESGITAVGAYDFYLPSSLTGMLKPMLRTGNIELPDSLTTIGAHAFENQLKLEKITFPQNLRTIGTDAFKGCTMLYGVDYYGNPDNLTWDVGTPFAQLVTLHIKPEYKDKLDALNRQYQPYNITVEANLHSTIESDGVERNINISMGQENSGVFGGAVPFVIVGTFSGQKKSVTYGSNGFASAVKIGTQYYVHENNSSHNLYKPVLNSGAGYVESLDKNEKCPLQLKLTHEYIGTNIVKVIYTLSNPNDDAVNDIWLGSAGDIKIGADDYATIKPLMENNEQTGFYMTSSKEYDKDENNNAATLGFIGKGVDGSADPATFFYGPVFANAGQSSTGAFRHRLMPERIFSPGLQAVQPDNMPENEEAILDTGKDSGMSYFWNVGSIEGNGSKQYAVLFSVYGADTESNGQEMAEEIITPYHTVTWNYGYSVDNKPVTYKVLVKEGDPIPAYSAETPKKPNDTKEYTFSHWVDGQGQTVSMDQLGTCTSDVEYTAVYNETDFIFFPGHSLTLQGDIGIYFYVDVRAAGIQPENIINGNNSIDFSFSWKTRPAPYTDLNADRITLDQAYYLAHPECYDNRESSSTKGFFKIKCNTAAAEMSCIVHASAIVKDINDNNKAVYTDSDDYSVRDYALTIINDPSKYGADLVNLSKAMLDYGAKAQTAFGIATNLPANKDVEYTMADVTPQMIEKAIYDANADYQEARANRNMADGTGSFGCNFYGATVVFLTKTTLRLIYTVSDQGTFDSIISGYSGTFTYNSEKPPFAIFELANIHAKELDTLQTFTIAGQTYRYSVLDYSRTILTSSTSSAAGKNLAKATYWYNYYANLYFDKPTGGTN